MGGTTVVDSLESTSTTSALSANQGRILNESIEALDTRVEELENSSGGNASNSVTRIWV